MTWELYFKILVRLGVMVWLGVFGGRLLEESGNAAFIHRLTRPLTRFANLPPFCGTAMASSFFAGFSGDALLGSYYQESRLSQREAILASMMLNFPFYVSFLPMLIGIVYPLLGNLGLLYLGIQVGVSLSVTTVAAVISHLLLKDGKNGAVVDVQLPQTLPIQIATQKSAKEAFKMTFKILLIAGPILAAVVLLVKHNAFSWLQSVIPLWVRIPGIPSVALPGVVAQGFHISSGAAVTGSMLHLKLITPKEGLLVMLAGNLLGTPFRSARILLPTYMGAYGGKTGVKVLFAVQGIRTFFVLLAYISVLLW